MPVPRRAVLHAAGTLAAAGVLAACGLGPVRLDRPMAVPQVPAPSATEAVRRRLAGGSRVLVDVLARLQGASPPGDVAARLPAWLDVHAAHLAALADVPPGRPLGRPATAPETAPALPPPAPLQAAQGQLRAATAGAADATVAGGGLATLALRIAVARGTQDRMLRTAAGAPVLVPAWAADAPPESLQALLAAQHAAVDGYVTAVAWSGARRGELEARHAVHAGTRDGLEQALAAAGQVPAPPEPGYAAPPELLAAAAAGDGDGRALQLALRIEADLLRGAVAVGGSLVPAEGGTGDDAVPVPPGVLPTIRGVVALACDVEATRQRWGVPPAALPGD